ncbi:MAG TPA: carboxypeptidase-like regulatory domain-containing protein, partial [Bacteroidales bacterium]|nr:carboxypeptidase-like regulatory domain-containing protein [Bacteroidales bacterium]
MKHFFKVIDTFIISLFYATSAFAQSGAIQGTITDAKTGESLIGTNIVLQGTYTGTTSDLEGNFKLANIPPGTYNLVVSYISYDQQILRITVKNNETTRVDVKLEPATLEIESVKVTAVRKTNTEMALISSLKASNVVANGISNQQIIRSQDKDASEVVRRVPGITIRDGRFVIVRGLVERYNVTWLNGIPAPSSEPDMRSFSFDLIPSSQIGNIVIYKTPAPELPADFAGAAIQISSLGISDRNSVSIAYSAGFIEGTTFRKYYSYKGGKYDWLGFDDGTRALPAGFPSTKDFRALASNSSDADKLRIQEIGRSFNKIWTPFASSSAPLNQNLNIAFTRRVLLGKSSLGLVSSVLYNRTTDSEHILRQGFQAYNTILDKSNPYYIYNDNKYKQTSRIGALLNMNFVFGNNQKIEFRNLVNQQGASTTTLRRGQNFYGGNYEKNYELDYQSRLTYTSSLGGKHTLFNQLTSFDWNAGYA